jgi:hypothetical protein
VDGESLAKAPSKPAGELVQDWAKVVAAIAPFGWLLYWTGRWYKQWYFAQFGIPYEALDFSNSYYLVGSWAAVATAVSGLALVLVPIALRRGRLHGAYLAAALVPLALAIVLQIYHPRFSPTVPWWRKLLGSRDLEVILCGILAICVLAAALFRDREAARSLGRRLLATPWTVLLCAFFLAWAYLAFTGYAVGTYHGQAAIWEGKMGTQWVRHGGSWWIFVARPETDRNFICDRRQGKMKIVKDADIVEWGGPVTSAVR